MDARREGMEGVLLTYPGQWELAGNLGNWKTGKAGKPENLGNWKTWQITFHVV